MTADQQKQLVDTLGELNTDIRRVIVVPDELQSGTSSTASGTGGAYPITVKLHGTWADAPLRAGYATVEDTQCTVELSDQLFQPDRAEYFKPVVWHEFGHCAGLQHVPEEGEIMYKTSTVMSGYKGDALQRFFSAIVSSAGL